MSDLFIEFLNHIEGAGQLWVLGDFVEYWIGDDAGDPTLNPVFDALRARIAAGTRVDFMRGNRDFLLGSTFGEHINATVHKDDELKVTLPNNETVLLMHGDTLCTDDVDYQRLRQMLRSDAWQEQVLNQSIAERIETAKSLREKSHDASAGKSASIMDVNEKAVIDTFTRNDVSTLIHGHTHRPNTHQHGIDLPNDIAQHNDAERTITRMVLGDWHDDHAMVAHASPTGLELVRFPAS